MIGVLNTASPGRLLHRLWAALRQGLSEAGYVDKRADLDLRPLGGAFSHLVSLRVLSRGT